MSLKCQSGEASCFAGLLPELPASPLSAQADPQGQRYGIHLLVALFWVRLVHHLALAAWHRPGHIRGGLYFGWGPESVSADLKSRGLRDWRSGDRAPSLW